MPISDVKLQKKNTIQFLNNITTNLLDKDRETIQKIFDKRLIEGKDFEYKRYDNEIVLNFVTLNYTSLLERSVYIYDYYINRTVIGESSLLPGYEILGTKKVIHAHGNH